MTNLKIVDDTKKLDLSPTSDGTYEGAAGGTEMMNSRLKASIDPKLLANFNIIKSRITNSFIDPNKINIFWAHDMAQDPEAQLLRDKSVKEKFDKIVFVSDWQSQQYQNFIGIKPSESVVMKNAIEPIPVSIDDKKIGKKDPIRLIYHTTPHRGLDILVPVFEKIAETENVHLDVFSSYKIYGWKFDEANKKFQKTYDRIEKHPNMTYHGYKPNLVVCEHLKNAHIFPFPSIWYETSCISLIEAMSAGVHCVYPNLAALPETGGGFGAMYQFHEEYQQHANMFYSILYEQVKLMRKTLETPKMKRNLDDNLAFQKMWIDSRYNWNTRKDVWQVFLEDMLANKK